MWPALAVREGGGWVVWQDNRIDRSGNGIAAQRIDAGFQGAGPVIRVNTKWSGHQERPAVVLLPNGGAAVAWQSAVAPGLSDVYARLLTPAGGYATSEFKVSSATALLRRRFVTNMLAYVNNRLITRRFAVTDVARVIRDLSGHPAVAVLPDGSVVVAYDVLRSTRSNLWHLETRVATRFGRRYTNDVLRSSLSVGEWGFDVFLRRYSATGRPLGAEVQVNQFAHNHQRYPSIAVLSNGQFVVSWISEERVDNSTVGIVLETDRVDVMGRLFTADAQPAGDEFTINTSANYCANPGVAPLENGGFVAVWCETSGRRPAGWDVFARAFAADGTTTHDAVPVNTYTTGDQFQPRVASLGAGQMVVWTSLGQDGSWEGVYGRPLAGGIPAGDEFQVNTSTASRQFMPAVSGATDGRFLTAWSGIAAGSSFDVFGQTYVFMPALAGEAGVSAGQETPGADGQLQSSGPDQSASGGGNSPPLATTTPPGMTGSSLRVGLALNRHTRELRWNTVAGARYQVQMSTNLTDWTNLGGPRTASAASDVLALTGEQAVAFFRVIQVP